jgi:hypothetical protein
VTEEIVKRQTRKQNDKQKMKRKSTASIKLKDMQSISKALTDALKLAFS